MASFEEQLKSLEEVVDRLEKGDLPLQESLQLFEKGMALSTSCKAELDAAEGQVQVLLQQKDGSRMAQDLNLES